MTSAAVSVQATPETLSEDLRTAWVPDVLGNVDVEPMLNVPLPADGDLGPVELFQVPRPSGTTLNAHVLGASAHGAFHRATEPLRAPIDGFLGPGVCGYRRGAERGYSYSTENVRFHELSAAEAEVADWVVLADVRRFFDHCTWDVVEASVAGIVGDDEATAGLREFADAARRSGLGGLPAGYADARLLANAVLAGVETTLHIPFARWVDDYRLFARTEKEAKDALTELRRALNRSGLSVNDSKVAILTASDFRATRGLSLTSVYHPDVEGYSQVSAALRSVFLQAVQTSPANRRELRFSLPRLAAEGDDIAVDWVLGSLESMPWEAPRFAAYLSRFADRPVVRDVVQSTLVSSLVGSPWLATRVAALACHTGVSRQAAEALAAKLQVVPSQALRGLVVRAVALSGHREIVESVTSSMALDVRAALAARRDVGLAEGAFASVVSPVTLAALGDVPAPPPAVDSIL